MRRSLNLMGLLLLIAAAPVSAESRFWGGGGVGLGFGDVTYVTVEPVVGYSFTDQLSGGVRLIFRYRDDGRFSPSFSTNDYGASLFGRYRVTKIFHVQAEYEYLNYEFRTFDGTERDNFDSVLFGGGISQPIGGRSYFFATALYNFSYDENELSPYGDPLVFRMGVTFGF